MYVPTFDSILRALSVDRASYESSNVVEVPKELFRLLIQIALESSEFNVDGYLEENPDVAEAVNAGDVDDPRAHYVGFGYFEGRPGGTPTVDEAWYMATYSDVAQAVKSGRINSAKEHYSVIGGSEGRSPSAEYVKVAARWKRALVEAWANQTSKTIR